MHASLFDEREQPSFLSKFRRVLGKQALAQGARFLSLSTTMRILLSRELACSFAVLLSCEHHLKDR